MHWPMIVAACLISMAVAAAAAGDNLLERSHPERAKLPWGQIHHRNLHSGLRLLHLLWMHMHG